MSLEELLKLLLWFEANTNEPIPIKSGAFLEKIEDLQKEIAEARITQTPDKELLEKADIFCKKYLCHSKNIYQASLLWLLDAFEANAKNAPLQTKIKNKIPQVFSQFLKHCPEIAIDLFEKEGARLGQVNIACLYLLKTYQAKGQERSLTNFQQLEGLIKEKLTKLQEVSQPLALLLHVDYEDTLGFASMLIWLLKRGIKAKLILKTGVLQNFLSYAFPVSESEEVDQNPLKLLYSLLAGYQEAETLLKRSAEVGVVDKALIAYNLQGKLCAPETLKRLKIKTPAFIGSLDCSLFQQLYTLFGMKFLPFAFKEGYESKSEKSLKTLQVALNEEDLVFDGLPRLVDYLCSSYKEEALKLRLAYLSQLIEARSIGLHLLKNKCLTILPLLPFCLDETRLNSDEFDQCVDELIEKPNAELSPADKFSLLMHWMAWIYEQKTATALLIFQKTALYVLSAIDQFLDYESLALRLMEIYQIIKHFIEEDSVDVEIEESRSMLNVTEDYLNSLEEDCQFNWELQCKLLLSHKTFNQEDYQHLQKLWKIYKLRQDFFSVLYEQDLEESPISLARLLFNKYLELFPEKLDSALMQLAGILFNLKNEEELYDYQYGIVDLIFTSEQVTKIKTLLFTLKKMNPLWYLIHWTNNRNLLKEAITQDRLYLVDYLIKHLKRLPNQKILLFKACCFAIQEKKIASIDIFLTNPTLDLQLNEDELTILFLTALYTNEESVFFLLMKYRKALNLTKTVHSKLFSKAAKYGYVWAIKILYEPIISFLPNAAEVDKNLLKAIKNDHLDFVKALCEREDIYPSEQAIEKGWTTLLLRTRDYKKQFIQACFRRIKSNMAHTCLDLFLNPFDYLKLVKTITWLEATSEQQLLILLKLTLEGNSWSVLFKQIVNDDPVQRAKQQERVTRLVLSNYIPKSNFADLESLFQILPKYLHPQKETFIKCFELSFVKRDIPTLEVLFAYGAQYLAEKDLKDYLVIAICEGNAGLTLSLLFKKKLSSETIAAIFEQTIIANTPQINLELCKKNLLNINQKADFTAPLVKANFLQSLVEICKTPDYSDDLWFNIFSEALKLRNSQVIQLIGREDQFEILTTWPRRVEELLTKGDKEFAKEIYTAACLSLEDKIDKQLILMAKEGLFRAASAILLMKEVPKATILAMLKMALEHQQIQFIRELCQAQLISVEQKKTFIPSLIHHNQIALIQSFCDQDPTYSAAFWNFTLENALENNKLELIPVVCQPERFYKIYNFSQYLSKAIKTGKLEQVKALIAAASSCSFPIQVANLKQEAQEAQQPEVADWFEQLRELNTYRNLCKPEKSPLANALELLLDYTKFNSRLLRFFSGAWNRHHISEVEQLLASPPTSLNLLLIELNKIKLVNPSGALARTITYLKDFLLPLEQELKREQSERLAWFDKKTQPKIVNVEVERIIHHLG